MNISNRLSDWFSQPHEYGPEEFPMTFAIDDICDSTEDSIIGDLDVFFFEESRHV